MSVLILLACLAIYFLGEAAFRSSEKAILQNYQTTYQVALKNSGRVLDMNLRSIVEVVRGFLNDKSLQTILKKRETHQSAFSTADRAVLETVAKRLARQQAWVNDIIFMDLNGNHYMLSNNRGSYEFDLYYNEHDYREEAWSIKTAEAKGKEVFFGKNVLGANLGDVLLMAKHLIDPDTGESMGCLAVSLSRALISRSYVGGGSTSHAGHFLVIDTDGEAIYYDGPGEEAERVLTAFTQLQDEPSGVSQGMVFSAVRNETTGWTLINAAKTADLTGDSRDLRNMVWIVGGIILAFVLGLLYLLFQNQYLARHLIETRLNEREAELLLLQSQINPHFLYNTLDALYFQAIIHGDDQIADTTMALSNHFRLTLNNGSKYISIKDSIQWIREYMKIMNLRFHDRFTLVVDAEDSLLERRILTFILQPFVENAMNHGLEPKMGEGVIRVSVKQDQGDLLLIIEDNGVGMEDLSVWESGYGIHNVQERIRLHYGEAYGASVESRKGEGTTVTVRLPLLDDKNEAE